MAIQPGSRIGSYEILAPLGAGGMGEVWKAHDSRINRDVAIKVLPEEVTSDPDRLARFEQEAQAAGALNHPNILTVFEMGTHDGRPYLVTELLEGSSLREKLGDTRRESSSSERLRVRKALEIGAQIANGLAAAHDKSIVLPRPEAREHLRDDRRAREDPRLRPRETDLCTRIRFGPRRRSSRRITTRFSRSTMSPSPMTENTTPTRCGARSRSCSRGLR